MIKINKYIKQQGNATSICLIAMAFFLILIAGTIFYNNSSVRASATARDHYQAQYWAEAGIKRAIDGFKTPSNNWSWLDNQTLLENWQNGSNNSQEKYHVRIYLKSDTAKTTLITPTTPLSTNDYIIIATGKVNNITHNMQAEVSVINNDPKIKSLLFRFGAYAMNSINILYDHTINSPFADTNTDTNLTAADGDGYKYYKTGFGSKSFLLNNLAGGSYNFECNHPNGPQTDTNATFAKWVKLDEEPDWKKDLGTNVQDLQTKLADNNRPILAKPDKTPLIATMADIIKLAKDNGGNGIFKNQTIYITDNFDLYNSSTLQGVHSLTFENVSIFTNGSFGHGDKSNSSTPTTVVNFNGNNIIGAQSIMLLNQQNLGNATYISFSDLTVSNCILNSVRLYAKNDLTITKTPGNTSNITLSPNMESTYLGYPDPTKQSLIVEVKSWTYNPQ